MLYRLTDVCQQYKDRSVLEIDHLEIESGRIHALLGPNGAGKTTLLNLLAFLEAPVSGTILFCGRTVVYSRSDILLLRRQVVLVDQHPIMFSTTVRNNIEFGLKIRKIDKPARLRAIEEVLETVGLQHYQQAPAHELSGGETQRLALARALALNPAVLLCDEPTASVDVENQAIIGTLLQQINADRGTTIVFTTHDRLQAASLAERTLVLEKGRPAPTTHENRYACTFISGSNGTLCCRLHGQVSIPVATDTVAFPTAACARVYINPEKITLVRRDTPPLADSDVIGTIVLTMAEGDKIRIVVHIGVLIVVLMDRTTYERQRPAIGETVALHFAAEAITCSEGSAVTP